VKPVEGSQERVQTRDQCGSSFSFWLRLPAKSFFQSVSAFFSLARQPHLFAPITHTLQPYANSFLTMLAGRTFAAPARQCLRQAARSQFMRPAFVQVSNHQPNLDWPIADDGYHRPNRGHTPLPLRMKRSPNLRVRKEAMYETPTRLFQHSRGLAIGKKERLMA